MGLTFSQAKSLGLESYWPQDGPRIALPEAAPSPTRFLEDGMNKTERRLSQVLNEMKGHHEILDWEFEPEKFRMADKTWYRPDFRVTLLNYINIFIEVKVRKKDGSILWTDDGAVKCKTVPEIHPIVLYLAVWRQGRWTITRMPSRKWGWINVDIQWRI